MQKKSKVFSFVLVSVLFLSIFPASIFGLENNASVDRIYGADRYETALSVAKVGWPEGSANVVLAPGTNANLVDALTAAPLAKSKNAPILLTQKDSLSAHLSDYLKLKTEKVYVVSGAIQSNVILELESMDIEVIGLGGMDRYSTATNIAKEIEDVTGVFVTTAASNADALSIASIAASKGMPILLAQFDAIPSVEADFLEEIRDDLTQSYVIGGTAVLSDAIKEAIPGEATRISGINRFATNLEVLKAFYAEVESYDKVYVANGTNRHLVDALVASTLAATTQSPIVMVDKDFNAETRTHVTAKLSATGKVIALGGESVVSPAVQTSNYVKAEDFGVMQVSGVNGYTVGFNLMNKDIVSGVEVSLYKDNTLLAKNVSTNKLFSLPGSQFSTPFNINGEYPGDGYWTNTGWLGTIYDVPTKAVISVNLFNGQNYTVVNTNLTGDSANLLTEDQKHVKAEDFGVMQISGVNGYSVGFSLVDGKDASDLSAIEVSLYDDEDQLLAKNTASYKVLRLTATQLSTPFNIDGSFQADGYWNYGTFNGTVTDVPAKAVIRVTYESTGLTYTTENTKLTGDPSKLGSAELASELAETAMVNADIAFGVSTVANRYAGEIVRVKATLTEGAAEDFALMYQEADAFHPLTFTDGIAWYGPESGFPLADVTSNFKLNVKEAGTYSYNLEVVRVSDSQVLASTTENVVASVVAPSIESDLATSLLVDTENAFSVTTAQNSDLGSTVRVKITLVDADAANVALLYQEGDAFMPLTFDENGVTWFGPESGFPLANLTSNFKVTFSEIGSYSYQLEIVSDDKVIGEAQYQVEVTAPVVEE